MKSKVFFAIAVFLSLGHSSLVLSAQPCCAKLEESLTCLPILETYLSQAIFGMYDAHTPLYNTLTSLSADIVYNRESLTRREDIDLIDAAALERYHDGIDRSLDAIPIATGNPCNLEGARTEIYASVDGGARILPGVMAAALSGNYPATEPQIESARIKVVNSIQTKWIKTAYDNIRRCANTTDTETLAATRSPQQASTTSIGQGVNGYFNAFKLLDIAITYEETNVTLIDDIRECQSKTFLGLRRQMNNHFALLEALCVKHHLGQYTGSVSVLFKIQQSSIGRSTDSQQATELYFQQIERLAKRFIFRLADDSEIVFSRTDQAQAGAAVMIARISSQFLDTIAVLRPEDSDKVDEARKTITKIGNEIAEAWFSLIKAALSAADQCGTSSTIETKMVKIETQILYLIRTLPESKIDLIRGKQVFNTKDEAQFMRIMRKISKYNYDYVTNLRAAAEILARVVCKGKTTGPNDIKTIRAISRQTSTAIANGVRALAELLRFSLCVKSVG